MNKRFYCLSFVFSLLFVFCFCQVSPTYGQNQELVVLYEKFRVEAKKPCGRRSEALLIGNQIVEKYNSEEFKEVIEYVKKKVAEIKEADSTCIRNNSYDKSYLSKNWGDFMSISQRIIDEEGDNPLALDVILTRVSVGFNRADVDKTNIYDNETLYFAKLAIQRIEAGQTSKNKNWGVFEPFGTKNEALSWMNYIIGWQMYHRLNQKKESLSYFYKSTQIGNEKKNDAWIYVTIGNNYYEEAMRIPEFYLDNTTEEIDALLGIDRAKAERAIDAFGRAYKILKADSRSKPEAKKVIADVITILYKFRFNLESVKNADDVDKYVENLTKRPMPDISTPVEPVSD